MPYTRDDDQFRPSNALMDALGLVRPLSTILVSHQNQGGRRDLANLASNVFAVDDTKHSAGEADSTTRRHTLQPLLTLGLACRVGEELLAEEDLHALPGSRSRTEQARDEAEQHVDRFFTPRFRI